MLHPHDAPLRPTSCLVFLFWLFVRVQEELNKMIHQHEANARQEQQQMIQQQQQQQEYVARQPPEFAVPSATPGEYAARQAQASARQVHVGGYSAQQAAKAGGYAARQAQGGYAARQAQQGKYDSQRSLESQQGLGEFALGGDFEDCESAGRHPSPDNLENVFSAGGFAPHLPLNVIIGQLKGPPDDLLMSQKVDIRRSI